MNGVDITVFGDTEFADRLRAKADIFDAVMQKRMHQIVGEVQAHIVTDHLSGPTGAHSLSRVRGNLARSVQTDVGSDDGTVIGRIFYTGDVPYAAIHEFGGVIHHPGGTAYVPLKSGLMMFISNAKATADMLRTKPHDILMPERAPMRTGFKEMSDYIVAQIKDGMREVLAS